MAIIGLTNLHYAIMTKEDTATTAPVYSKPKRIIGVNSLTVDPENDKAVLYGDNQALDTKTSTRENTVTLEVARMPLEDQAAILGYQYDSDTKTMDAISDASAPNVAIMYEVETDENKKWYRVFYKGKFAPSSEEASTRGESLDYGLHSMEGSFVSRIDGKHKKPYSIREIDETEQLTITDWFNSIVGAE